MATIDCGDRQSALDINFHTKISIFISKRDDCPSIATSIENDVVEKENDDDALLVDYTSDNEDVKGKDRYYSHFLLHISVLPCCKKYIKLLLF